jgi:hypothetical protein
MLLSEARQALARYDALGKELATLREQQFPLMAERITDDAPDYEPISSLAVQKRLREFAVHLVSQLFQEYTPGIIEEMVDQLADIAP